MPFPDDISVTFDKLENPNKVDIIITTELDCKFEEGEYGLHIVNIRSGALDKRHFELIEECIVNDLDRELLPQEGQLLVKVVESGEWEDVFWHGYYKIESTELIQ